MIAVHEHDDATVVEVSGDFSEPAADEFGDALDGLIDRHRVRVVLNLKRATWISLKALKWLVGYLRKLRQRDGDLKLANPNPYWTNLLELTQTHHLFDVYPSVDDAVASYRLVSPAVR